MAQPGQPARNTHGGEYRMNAGKKLIILIIWYVYVENNIKGYFTALVEHFRKKLC